MDTPRPDTFWGKRILTAHLLSTLPGGAGTSELLAFAKKLGMKAEWIQHRGGYNEHFDLMGARCQAAREAGALVDGAVVARTIREKREAARPLQPVGAHVPPENLTIVSTNCSSCLEGDIPRNECPQSKRECGHHCNHAWSHEHCCWCDQEVGEQVETGTEAPP